MTTMPALPTAIRLADLLHELGGTADAVAETLTAAGITGVPISSKRCPIARYLGVRLAADRGLDAPVAVSVSQESVFAVDEHHPEIRPPKAVADFVSRFDAHLYVDLLDRSDR